MDVFSLVPNGILFVLGVIFSILIVAHAITFFLRKKYPTKNFLELTLRIKSWWIIVIAFMAFILFNQTVAIVSLSFLSYLALKEYLSLIPTRRVDRRVLFFAYLSIPLHYFWVLKGWYGMFIIFIPVYTFLFLHIVMLIIGETKGYLRATGTLHWGLMVTVFALSHLAYLLALPARDFLPSGTVGMVLFLVVLTQLNDVFQYIWGKLLGKHNITPKVSPNKTVEGFLGGMFSTIIFSILLAPHLTPLSLTMAVAAGILISLAGFMGDLNISAFKRDIGVKDTGQTIPGHGGILDRIDSLTFTSPLFFHFIYYFYF